MLQRQSFNSQNISRFMPATDLKIGTFVSIPNFNTQKGISKKLQQLRKGPYQIIAKPTEVTYKPTKLSETIHIQNKHQMYNPTFSINKIKKQTQLIKI